MMTGIPKTGPPGNKRRVTMAFNQATWASAVATTETVAETGISVDYLRARDFATECWRRALHQRVRPVEQKAA
jgi:hypothetical protein